MKYSFLFISAVFALASCQKKEVSSEGTDETDEKAEYVSRLEERLASMERQMKSLEEELSTADAEDFVPVVLAEEEPEEEITKGIVSFAPAVPLAPEGDFDLDLERQISRTAARGEVLGTVHTLDGRVLEEVKIVEVTDVGLEVWHANGTARLHFDQLPQEFGNRFFYVPELARKTLRLERLADAEREKRVREYTIVKLQEESEKREKELAARMAVLEERQRNYEKYRTNTVVHTGSRIASSTSSLGSSYYPRRSSTFYSDNSSSFYRQPTIVVPPRVYPGSSPTYCPPARPSRPSSPPPKTYRPSPASPKVPHTRSAPTRVNTSSASGRSSAVRVTGSTRR